MDCTWEVVGGATSGGIIVRDGQATTAAQATSRLGTGSIIRALEIDSGGGRLQYELLEGNGPPSGWVSTKFQGKALLAKTKHDTVTDNQTIVPHMTQDRQTCSAESEHALCKYMQRLGKSCMQQATIDYSLADNVEHVSVPVPKTLVQMEVDRAMSLSQEERKRSAEASSTIVRSGAPYKIAKDVDGEELHLCSHCSLPLGEFAYIREGKYMHGECVGQMMEKNVRVEDEIRRKGEKESKDRLRAEYDIGWDAAHIPCNSGSAKQLQGQEVPGGMICVVLDEAGSSVKVAATNEPAAAINLEYLSIALEVRRREGHEPVFSLNPVNAKDKQTMQEKVFTPEWLAGTSAGEVLFQADYILKELSMGECEQPVAGMKSCFALAEADGCDESWNAREWFMVRKAEVELSNDNVLIPCVKLGVEARSMVLGQDGLQDAPVTRADHPMVKYAASFTHNFDLIAERRSAIFHLRELAKAVALAKFMIESKLELHEDWFHLADKSKVKCSFGCTVPQLWHERLNSCLNIENGAIVGSNTHVGARLHGIYGGVNLTMEHFDLAASIAGRSLRGSRGGRVPVPPSSGAPFLSSAESSFGRPKGVDLRLDKFNLSTLRRVPLDAQMFGNENACAAFGRAFWSALDNESKSSDQEFLQTLFNPRLSDRRMEGDLFVPPRTDVAYIEKMKTLLLEEGSLLQKQKDAFFSTSFNAGLLRSLFPSSWRPAVCFRESEPELSLQLAHLADPLIIDMLRTTQPTFDQATEEGSRFRIYRMGNLEVRTVQEVDRKEFVGAIFSVSSQIEQTHAISNKEEKIVKVLEFVDRAVVSESSSSCSYFVVLETEHGNSVLTEQSLKSKFVWQENPQNLEARKACAKTLRCTDCSAGITLEAVRALTSTISSGCPFKHYSRAVYGLACGRGSDPTYSSNMDSTWVLQSVAGRGRKMPFPRVERKPSTYKLMAQCLK